MHVTRATSFRKAKKQQCKLLPEPKYEYSLMNPRNNDNWQSYTENLTGYNKEIRDK